MGILAVWKPGGDKALQKEKSQTAGRGPCSGRPVFSRTSKQIFLDSPYNFIKIYLESFWIVQYTYLPSYSVLVTCMPIHSQAQ